MVFLAIWAVVSTAIAVYLYIVNKKKWRTADRLLDNIISGRKIDISDLNEDELSLFASRLDRISDKLQIEIGRAEDEKEQVKQLISNMSHQLKTPLANVIMYIQLLENDTLTNEKRVEFTEKLKAHAERINWILNSLFKMTKLERDVISFEAENLPIKDTLIDAVNAVYEKADSKKIEIKFDNMSNIKLWHNRKWTAEVFENLLENAIKYSPQNSSIKISVECFEMHTSITISDNGMGIRENELSLIFHRFYRSNDVENIEGSGIGLYLSKIILEKEKGYITVSSEYGNGSRFSVFLRNFEL